LDILNASVVVVVVVGGGGTTEQVVGLKLYWYFLKLETRKRTNYTRTAGYCD
jgi:hypothetical protein